MNANWTTTLLVYYVCVSSTLDLFVLFTLQRKLCIAFQGAMSFSPKGKIASSHEKRAVRTIVEMGFEVNKNGDENPIYTVKCAEEAPELLMFSKLFDDESVKFHPFGAVMTCDHADENCPFIPIADARIPLRYEDPKKFDDTELEEKMYHERSLQIATELFYCYSLIKK